MKTVSSIYFKFYVVIQCYFSIISVYAVFGVKRCSSQDHYLCIVVRSISICICQYTALGLSFVFIVTSRSFCVHCCHAGTRVPVHEVSLQDVVLLTWHYKAIMVLLFLCPHHCGQRWLTCKHACGYRLKYFIVSVALLPSCRSFNSLAPFWHETWIQTSQPRRFLQSLVLATVLASTQAVSYQWFIVCASTCSWRVTTYVGKPSAVGQPIRPTQPFILSG